MKKTRIAIVGGGVSGTATANRLMSSITEDNNFDVHIFDQGQR